MSHQGTSPGPNSDARAATVIDAWASSPHRGVIFDFNGTLSDDEPLLLRIYSEMFLHHLQWTLTPRHYYARLAGRSDREIIDIIVEESRRRRRSAGSTSAARTPPALLRAGRTTIP